MLIFHHFLMHAIVLTTPHIIISHVFKLRHLSVPTFGWLQSKADRILNLMEDITMCYECINEL